MKFAYVTTVQYICKFYVIHLYSIPELILFDSLAMAADSVPKKKLKTEGKSIELELGEGRFGAVWSGVYKVETVEIKVLSHDYQT